MLEFILRRLLQSVLALWAMSLLVFAGVYVVGDPIALMVPDSATPEMRTQIIASLGLDQPAWLQYWHFLTHSLHGDFGTSFLTGAPVAQMILARMPATLELSVIAMLMAIVIGIPLGMYAGLRPEKLSSRLITASSTIGFSLPTFWVGLIMILVCSVLLGWLPSGGRGATRSLLGVQVSFLTLDGWKHLILPAFNLALFNIALIIRLAYSSTREAALTDYVKFARAKGLSASRIVGVHILKNIMIPLVTVIGINLGGLIAFSIVTETVFAWPGMGKLLIDSINGLDRPVVIAYLLTVAAIYMLINLVVDILYSLLDPRISVAAQGE
ncbi:ABC transporter permease [Paraburkholderia sp. J63]|uniref:ABC transporter permease n=1 Tax=Paraburkholderia sp. J63 TaxID=2805434 RepID=UPI002ABD3F0F|nr:ABC transporter permease [Paraburkholderia sp. J63]